MAVAIGEAMIEMAPVGDGLYRRGFAGDTFNTAWHMAVTLESAARVGFVTRVGQDKPSDAFFSKLGLDGLDTSAIGRESDRTMGLHLIELDGVERSIFYWRSQVAARRLADDPAWLAASMAGADLIHLSGITAAILAPEARARLIDALATARSRGTLVSFDPNIRPSLRVSADETRATFPEFLKVTDIALPSIDDENTHWGDATPYETLDRFAAHGVAEIVVKSGAGRVSVLHHGERAEFATPAVTGICETTGAGDAFNAGYLAARLVGQSPELAVTAGQKTVRGRHPHFRRPHSPGLRAAHRLT